MRCRTFSLLPVLFFVAPGAQGYDNDTHYVLTYALARSVGYTPEQARRTAAANLSIDAGSNTTTEPVQDYSVLEDAFNPRVWFHAFRDVRRTDSDSVADQYMEDQLGVLQNDAVRLQNPGVYMHSLMDSFAHHGYWCRFGHVDPAIPPVGHTTDYASYQPSDWQNRNQQMANASVGALFQFLADNSNQNLRAISFAAVKQYLGLLVQANPTPFWDASPDFEAARTLFNDQVFMFREGAIPEPEIYALHGKEKVASPRSSALPTFSLWENPAFTVELKPNLAGIGLGPGTLTASYYDGWDAADSFQTLGKLSVPSAGGTVQFQKVPAGPVRFDYLSKRSAASKIVNILKPTSTGKVTFNWDTFTIKPASTGALTIGSGTFSKFRAFADIESLFPDGTLSTGFTMPFQNGRLKVVFGGADGSAKACTFGWLGWNGFHAKNCTVYLAYLVGGKVQRSGTGKGSFTLKLADDGSARISWYAAANGLAATAADWSAPAGSLLAQAL